MTIHRLRLLAVVLAAALLVACSPDGGSPTLDTSSNEAMQKSIQAMTAAMPEEDRVKLGPAILALAMSQLVDKENPLQSLTAVSANPDAFRMGLAAFQGKAGDELVALAMALPNMGAAGPANDAPDGVYCYKGKPGLIDVTSWAIEPLDAQHNRVTLTLRSALEKHVRMIEGTVSFDDALGENIGTMAMDRDVELPPGGDHLQDGRWGQYTFERLLTLNHDEVEVRACVSAVLYDDGSKETFE